MIVPLIRSFAQHCSLAPQLTTPSTLWPEALRLSRGSPLTDAEKPNASLLASLTRGISGREQVTSGLVYTGEVTPAGHHVSLSVRVPAHGVSDPATNQNVQSNTKIVIFDNVNPLVVGITTDALVSNISPLVFKAYFTERISTFLYTVRLFCPSFVCIEKHACYHTVSCERRELYWCGLPVSTPT